MPHALIRVDRGVGEPLYRQIRRAIEQAIATGMIVPAERLPSSRELAGELGVSRNTINLAYQELLADGAIVSEPRRGLFVDPDMPRPGAVADTETGGVDWSARLVQREAPGLPEVEKRPGWHTYSYPFLAGQSDPHAFPTQAWLRSLRRSRRLLSEKWQVTTAAVRAQLPWPQPAYPPGGASLWMSGPAGIALLGEEARRMLGSRAPAGHLHSPLRRSPGISPAAGPAWRARPGGRDRRARGCT